jgi:hypothetical protein
MVDNRFQIRALEACTSFVTHDVLDMGYFEPLVRRAAEHGINTLVLFVIPDSYYPETSPTKSWTPELGLDWPSDLYPHFRNPRCPNADPTSEFMPDLVALCHTLGIKAYLRTINNKHRWLFPEQEDWRAVRLRPDGVEQATDACCWDVPGFMAYYWQVLDELLRRYATGTHPVDGLILDQQKCFGPYVNAESRARFEQLNGRPMDYAKPQEIRDYWSATNAERVRETVAFSKAISPTLDVGVTLEALKADHLDTGESGLKYELFNHRTTGVDFIHHQIIDHSEDEMVGMWEKLTSDGPTWVMLDPTAADAGWDKPHWGWVPRTPDSIQDEVAKVQRARERLSNPARLVGLSEFPISRLPLDHPNLTAVLREVGSA